MSARNKRRKTLGIGQDNTTSRAEDLSRGIVDWSGQHASL
jgi:hypothetical protein